MVVAARQTRGRGRSGSEWQTAPRALALSIAFRLDSFESFAGVRQSLIPLVLGLAAAGEVDAQLKWPNDLLLSGRKLGGVLVETTGAQVVAGCGLNLYWPDPPADRIGLFSNDPGPLAPIGYADRISSTFLERMARGPDAWGLDEYRARSATLGRQVTWSGGGEGAAFAVDALTGALWIETAEGTSVQLTAGEVRHLR